MFENAPRHKTSVSPHELPRKAPPGHSRYEPSPPGAAEAKARAVRAGLARSSLCHASSRRRRREQESCVQQQLISRPAAVPWSTSKAHQPRAASGLGLSLPSVAALTATQALLICL